MVQEALFEKRDRLPQGNGRWSRCRAFRSFIGRGSPAQECSASTMEELSNKPIRLYVSIRTNQGLMIQQNNLTYRQLLSLVEKLEVLC